MPPGEIELKFSLDAATFARLRRSRRLRALTIEPVRTRHLVSTYYDTKDGRLSAAGIAWRLRREGRSIVQTIKTEDAKAGLSRGEWEVELRGALPDLEQIPAPELVRDLRARLAGLGIEPKAKTDVRRTWRRLKTARGDIVEAALDAVVFSNGAANATGHELELELAAGDAASLFEVARPLVSAHALELCLVSKAETALHAGEGAKPAKAPILRLPENASAAEALSIVLTQTMRHLTHHARLARVSDSPEAIHQIRVSLRRIRAALNSYGRSFRSPRLDVLAGRARDLANSLSLARDLDVFVAEILGPAEKDTSNPGALALLSAELAQRRAAACRGARDVLSGPTYRLLLLDLAEVALCGFVPGEGAPHPAGVPGRALAAEILDHRLAKARVLAERFAELTTDERHDLRKELKKLRYPSELFASLFAKGVKRYFASLAMLQDDLGHLNDVATARGLLHQLVAAVAAKDPSIAGEASFVAGEIVGWHAHRAGKSLKRVRKHWEEFAKSEPFWRR
jgi:inorganic triphosphatase YgiF